MSSANVGGESCPLGADEAIEAPKSKGILASVGDAVTPDAADSYREDAVKVASRSGSVRHVVSSWLIRDQKLLFILPVNEYTSILQGKLNSLRLLS